MAVGIGQVADFVDRKECWAGIVIETTAQRGVAVKRSKIAKQTACGGEQCGVTGEQGLMDDVLNDHCLADAVRADHHAVAGVFQEVERHQRLDGGAVLVGGALVVDQRLDMGGVLDLRALVVAAPVTGQDMDTIDDAQLLRVRQHRQRALHIGSRHGIVVEVKANVGRLADLDRHALMHRGRVVRQLHQLGGLHSERFPYRARRLGRAAPVGRHTGAPGVCLRIEVVEIVEAAGCEERVPDVPNGPLDAAFFVAARHRHRARFVTVVSGKGQQRGMEANRIAAPFQNRTLKIVIEHDTGHALKRLERRDVPAQEILHAGIEKEAQEDLP